ncbi:hypothetical protein GGQ84_001090 [Desulfitispora alkaliphila]|uniref:NAD(P)/FAD-dependent oxidoreductase n=1 Tax=Desulfitispora alkaliphila TaxID=622674 RepID=UPI003D21E717
MLKNHKEYDLIVIGAGAAGMLAAGYVAQRGYRVALLERNSILGKKLLITGKGRCNLTNAGDEEEFINAFGKQGSFLYSAIYSFTSNDTISFFKNLGLETKVERGNRVFPVTDKSHDVVDKLELHLKKSGADIFLEHRVKKVKKKDGVDSQYTVETTKGKILKSKTILLTTGGASYPKTGTTGDGYKLAEDLGHRVVPISPALVPLELAEDWAKELQGLSLRNVQLSIVGPKGKAIDSQFGEMIFTHFGISGPIVLTLSNQVQVCLKKGPVPLHINLKPALTLEQLDNRILRDFEEFANKQFKNSLSQLLPQKLIPVIIRLSQVDPEKKVNQITKSERDRLIQSLTELKCTVVKTRPLEEAIVTAGGVDLKEIDPRTMESKVREGIYFAGEVMNIDGVTGGYNLQAAFSTGYLAAKGIEEKLEEVTT